MLTINRSLKDRQFWISLSLSLMLSISSLYSSISNSIGQETRIDAYFMFGLYYIILFYALIKCMPRWRLGTIIFTLFVIAAYVVPIVLDSPIKKYIWTSFTDFVDNPTYHFFFRGFLGYLLIIKLTDYKLFSRMFEKITYLTIILMAFYYIFVLLGYAEYEYMTFSYNGLVPLTYISVLCLQEFRYDRLLISVIGLTLILLGGARGAFISYIATLLVAFFLIFRKMNAIRKPIIIFGIAVLGFLISLEFNSVIISTQRLLSSYNLTSRTLTKLLTGDMFSSNSRIIIRERVLASVSMLGNGFFYDRILLDGTYSHNLFVEWLCDFGYIIGSFLIILFVWKLMKAIIILEGDEKLFLVSLLSCGFFKLMFSGSYLSGEPSFYIILGILSKYRKGGGEKS